MNELSRKSELPVLSRVEETEFNSGERLKRFSVLPAGYVVGKKYALTKFIGAGSSGAVYEGEHREIGRRFAIKVIHHALSTRDEITERFKIEAAVCGRMSNRHLVQVYDVGQLADGSPYMVMELLKGLSLDTLLEKGPMPIGAAIEVGKQLLSALGAAHAFGVVHRDVKPGNIIITKDVTGDTIVKLVDFGICMPITEELILQKVKSPPSGLSLEATLLGSPDYMPPEQLRGRYIDYRTDLYAAGAVLYEMITGSVPFNAPSLNKLIMAILYGSVTPPSRIRSECSAALERVVFKAMSRNKTDRFASAAAMARALAAASSYQYSTDVEVWDLREERGLSDNDEASSDWA
jgi:serine/threonine-protein kinase